MAASTAAKQTAARIVERDMKQNLPEFFVANPMSASIVARVKWNWKWFRVAGLLAVVALGAGCGGIPASKGISILDMLLVKNEAPAAPAATDRKPVSPPH